MFGEGVGAIFQGRLDRGVIVQGALGARHFLVQRFALEIADHPAIEVELVQVAAAVVQVIELALVGYVRRLSSLIAPCAAA